MPSDVTPRTEAAQEALDKVASLAGWYPFDEWRDELAALISKAQAEAAASLSAQLDNAYTERNLLIAYLFRRFPLGIAWWTDAPDAEGYVIVYLETDEGQLSWHMKADEARDIMPDWLDHTGKNAGKWDGHTTAEKYARLERLASR